MPSKQNEMPFNKLIEDEWDKIKIHLVERFALFLFVFGRVIGWMKLEKYLKFQAWLGSSLLSTKKIINFEKMDAYF